MKPPSFEYLDPSTVAETLTLLDQYGEDAKILAGGQSLVPLLNFRLAAAPNLIDINGVTELADRAFDGDAVRLGALTRIAQLETQPEIVRHCPLLAQAAPHIAHPQIRSRGTVGGSLAHADPSAELPGVAVAVDATMHVLSSDGERRIPAGDFFLYHLTTVLEPGELLAGIEIPKLEGRHGSCFLELAARRGDYATAGAAVVIGLGDDDRIAHARIVCIAAGPTPLRMRDAEELLLGVRYVDEALAVKLRDAVAESVESTDQLRASASYRKRASGILVRDAVRRALSNARGEQ